MRTEQPFWCDSCNSAARSSFRMVDPVSGRPCYSCWSCTMWLMREGWEDVPAYLLPGPSRESSPSLAELLAPYTVRVS